MVVCTENPRVGGSIPSLGTCYFNRLAKVVLYRQITCKHIVSVKARLSGLFYYCYSTKYIPVKAEIHFGVCHALNSNMG